MIRASSVRGWCDRHGGPIPVGIAVIVSVYALIACVGAVQVLNASIVANAATTEVDREWGVWRFSPRVIRDPSVVELASRVMPERASYAIEIGPQWRPTIRTQWSSSLERDFIQFHLLPRRLTSTSRARWVFCLACRRNRLGGAVVELAEGADGMAFLRVER